VRRRARQKAGRLEVEAFPQLRHGEEQAAAVGSLLPPELVCGADIVEAKRPRPTCSRGPARSRQRRRGGALRLPELVCGAGTVEAKEAEVHPQPRRGEKPNAAAERGAAATRTRLWRGHR
jgi:hypothetical protein